MSEKNTVIGQVEDDWDVLSIGDIASLDQGKTYPNEYQGESGEVDVAKVEDFSGELLEIRDTKNKVTYNEANELGLISNGETSIGTPRTGQAVYSTNCRLIPEGTAYDDNIISITPSEANTLFIYYVLRYASPKNYTNRSSVPSTTQGLLSLVRVGLPPIAEQRRIASVLYSVDEQLGVLHDRHDRLSELKHGLMQDLLTGSRRIDKEAEVTEEIIESGSPSGTPEDNKDYNGKNRDFKIEGDFARPKWSGMTKPEGWSRLNIGENTDVQGGYAFSSDKFGEKYRSEGHPLIKRGSVNDERYPDQFTIEEFDDKYSVTEYDILVSMDGNFNSQIWRFETKGALNQRVCLLRTNNALNPYYLYYLLKPLLRHTEMSLGATTVKSLSINDFDHMNPAVPPLWEQERIASVLYTVDKMIARTSDLRDEYERLKRGLMQDLLSGDVRTPEHLTVLDEISTDASNS